MLGFSLGKLLVLVAIVVAIWYGFKFVTRLDKRRKAQLAEVKRTAEANPKEAGDMVKCRVCGVYVLSRGAMDCGRPDCPY